MAIRTYGLSGSGMDVDQMVKDMMKARRIQYDKMYQEKTRLEYKKKDFNTIYTTLKEFREKNVFDFRMASQLRPMKATASDSSVATVTANADAVPINHTVEVTSLATAAMSKSAATITTSADKSTLASQFGLDSSASFDVTLNDGVNTKTITVDPTKSIHELAASINNAGLNIRANYDTTLDRFYLYNLQTGSANKLQVTDASVDVGGAAKQFFGDVLKLGAVDTAGTDAMIKIDGVEATAQASNKFTVSGLTFDLKKTGTTTIDVGADVDKAVENVKAFIESYNSTVKKITDELGEKYYRDFNPLTTDQKKDMKDDEIKAWEEKAKSGMLRNDAMLRGLVGDLRINFAEPVSGLNGNYKSATDLGITTASYVDEDGKFVDISSLGGMLSVDEKKLRTALNSDPDALYKIFATTGATNKESGVSRRLYDTLKAGLDKIVVTAGRSADLTGDTDSTLAKRLDDMNKRMSNEERRLKDLEARYYRQFDAMEVALQRMSSQSNWLAQQFSS
ncbi:hypothetical protein AXX12_08695 [Anaerosporomusa subterranea]|uniref:Flagellar hook-associated protein 2 n=1 Tax=Anaerosporomusa subterranea TaxID=1794912 RepID=A0A154BRE4_ANASB|nr:flagellar filament capping protein FliD [Anaerosporomusa subterranea]KYZ76501.1 hypothetical protein AXX12_08695 [Anaerosporomusa subterranea]